MGVLQKAYAFVKKHWSTDDDVFPDDLNRYEDGIEDLYSRTTEQSKQIGVLSEKDVALEEEINGLSNRNYLPVSDNRDIATKPSDYKLKFTFAGLKSTAVTGLSTWSHVFGVNAYSGIDGYTNIYEYAFCDGKLYIRSQYPLNEDTWGEWQQLATTAKTDISSSDLRNLWKIDRTPTVYKIGGKIFLSGIIREGITTNDTVMMVLPEGFRPKETTYKNVIVNNLIYQIYILQNGNVVINNHNMPSNSIVRFDLSFE